MAKVPFGNAARATRRVASGIGCSSSGRNDIRLLLPALVGAREQPNRSADQGPAEFATSVKERCGPQRDGNLLTQLYNRSLTFRCTWEADRVARVGRCADDGINNDGEEPMYIVIRKFRNMRDIPEAA